MRSFIVDFLMALINNKNMSFTSGAYSYGGNDRSVIRICGKIQSGLANFSIIRLRPDGTVISIIPIFNMVLSRDAINNLANFAIKAL